MELYEKTLSSETIYEGKVIRVTRDEIELPDGKRSVREVVGHPGGACAAALDEQNRLLMVEQYRYPMGERVLEIPAGKLEYGENPAAAVARELREETGCTADRIEPLGTLYPTPGYCAEKLYIYLATGLHAGAQQLDEDENLAVRALPLRDALGMVDRGELKDAKTVAAILLTARRLGL